MTYPYGPGTPVVGGPGDMTVDEFLKDPLRIQRTIEQVPNQYFLGEALLRPDTSTTGVVLYDELTDLSLYVDVDGGQPGEIEPGDEFPLVSTNDEAPKVTRAATVGAAFHVADQQRRSGRRDVISRNLRRVVNTLRKIHDDKIITAVTSNTTTTGDSSAGAGTKWDASSPDPLADITAGINTIDHDNDLGYSADTAMIHPDAWTELQNIKSVKDYSPRENTNISPLFNKQVDGLKGLNWIVSRRVPRTKVIILQRQMIGSLVSAIPPFTDVIDQRERLRTRVQAGRVEVPTITDPLAAYIITGVL